MQPRRNEKRFGKIVEHVSRLFVQIPGIDCSGNSGSTREHGGNCEANLNGELGAGCFNYKVYTFLVFRITKTISCFKAQRGYLVYGGKSLGFVKRLTKQWGNPR